MSDTAGQARPPVAASSGAGAEARLRRRHGADRRLRIYGIAAIGLALTMLGILVGSIFVTGYPAFKQTKITLDVYVPAEDVNTENPFRASYGKMIDGAIDGLFPEFTERLMRHQLHGLVSQGAQFELRDRVMADPALIGQIVRLNVPSADPVDQLHKGFVDRRLPEDRRRLSDFQIAAYDKLAELGRISAPLNWALVTRADSRFPELAGLKGALIGSIYLLLVCTLTCFPVGIASAIYLEEFAPRNRWTDFIEVNINNLAAVPSIVFGLLGLVVFLQFFGMPRSAPLVGGMVLALMTLPTIIIVTRAALKSVPPSIREAALGIGASQIQVVFHHVLPLAMPGILTGTIIGLARALGETAPLLLIGMNAFITAAPDDILSASTAMPTQIFIWADSPERGFVSRTSAGIIVLLLFLVCMNGLAVYLRHKFERRW